jgi:hypothetical protein
MDQIEAIAAMISAVNFVMLLLNYIALPVRGMRQKTEDLLVEIIKLRQRVESIELDLGFRNRGEKE